MGSFHGEARERSKAIPAFPVLRCPPPVFLHPKAIQQTHVVGDFFHLVLLHEEDLGDLLAGALQDAGDQGVIAGSQLLLLCKRQKHRRSAQQTITGCAGEGGGGRVADLPPLVWTMYSANSSAEFSI